MTIDPGLLLAGVMVVALNAYALLGGADFGGGVWDLLASGKTADAQRATIARTIAPVWEANHVWLIIVVTILFNAFPAAFARMSVELHIPIALALLGIVLRGSAFAFRAYGPSTRGYLRTWSIVFASASTITPLLLGAIVGALTEGRFAPATATFSERYVAPWLTPFALANGLFALVLFAYLAAVYLTLEARERATVEAFRTRALGSGVLAAALAVAILVLSRPLPEVGDRLLRSPWGGPIQITAAVLATATFLLLWRDKFVWARVTAALQVSLILWGWALAQYPYLVRPDLTVAGAAAPRNVLVILLWILAAGALVLGPALVYLFTVFRPAHASKPAAGIGPS